MGSDGYGGGWKVGLFHPGTQHSRITAAALQSLGRLAWYATSIFQHPGARLTRIAGRLPESLSGTVLRELKRFAHPALDPSLVVTQGWHEWAERLATRARLSDLARRLDTAGNAAFGWQLERLVRRDAPLVLWGFDGSSRTVFEQEAAHDCPKVLDRTIGDWRAWNALLPQVREQHGEWLDKGICAVGPAAIARDEAEYAAATRILCPSVFVAKTIRRHSTVPDIADKLTILPYCYDPALFTPSAPPHPRNQGPVRFLFVGQLSARKGVQHVLEAIAQLPATDAQLTLVGGRHVPARMLVRYADRVVWRPAVPRREVPALMRAHDVLLLPSWFEGSAITLLEALASGLAVIATSQAGVGPTERSGIRINRPDTQLLLAAMLELIRDPERLAALRQAAPEDAAQYDFARYSAGIATFLDTLTV